MSTHLRLGTGGTSMPGVMGGQAGRRACAALAHNTHLSGQHIFGDSVLWQGRPRMFSGHLSAGFQRKLPRSVLQPVRICQCWLPAFPQLKL